MLNKTKKKKTIKITQINSIFEEGKRILRNMHFNNEKPKDENTCGFNFFSPF